MEMKSFAQFLNEGRDAPLYHGTHMDRAESIIDGELILPATTHDHSDLLMKSNGTTGRRGVSLTRNKALAMNYGGATCYFVLDQRKLSQAFRIIPIQYFQGSIKGAKQKERLGAKKDDMTFNEYEEFVLTSRGIPLKYVTGFYYESDEELAEDLQEKLNKLGIKFGSYKIGTQW